MERPPLYAVWRDWVPMQLAHVLTAQLGRRAGRRAFDRLRGRK